MNIKSVIVSVVICLGLSLPAFAANSVGGPEACTGKRSVNGYLKCENQETDVVWSGFVLCFQDDGQPGNENDYTLMPANGSCPIGWTEAYITGGTPSGGCWVSKVESEWVLSYLQNHVNLPAPPPCSADECLITEDPPTGGLCLDVLPKSVYNIGKSGYDAAGVCTFNVYRKRFCTCRIPAEKFAQ